jgi:hypothetical protein
LNTLSSRVAVVVEQQLREMVRQVLAALADFALAQDFR